MQKRFWNWQKNDGDSRTLYLTGPISEESWFGDEITPKMFKSELNADTGPVTVWINSYGGDVFCAAELYNALKEYPGRVTVKVDGIAASAASVVAMAGDEVLMSPVSCMMLHNPSTVAIGDSEEMLRAKALLDEIKESLVNAYEAKTGLRRAQLGHMMNAETWMNAHKAIELGFADGILYADAERKAENSTSPPLLFSRMAVTASLLDKLPRAPRSPNPADPGSPEPIEQRTENKEQENDTSHCSMFSVPCSLKGAPVASLYRRLDLIHNLIA